MKRLLPSVITTTIILFFVLFLVQFLPPQFMPINIPPPFRSILWVLLGICAVLLIISYLHDPASSATPSQKPSRPALTASGTVVGFGGNPSGDIDKIALEIDHDSVWFHFPPHTAGAITGLAGIHARVSVIYRDKVKHAAEKDKELISIKETALDREISIADIPPPSPRAGQSTTVSGGKDDLMFPADGQARFFILSGKRIVLSPRSSETVFPLLRSGITITVTGDQRSDADGFVSQGGLPMVRATVIKIDTISYLVE